MVEDLLGWLAQSAIAAALLAAAVYLCRNIIEARLTRSVQHEFDQRLAKFQSQLEEETRRRDSVRSTAFAALLAQRSALAAKRIEAAQGLWNGVLEARKGISVALHLENLQVERLVERSSEPKIRQFLNALASGEVMSNEYLARVNTYSGYQPFVSPTAWALYAVYSAVVVFSISKMKILQLGEDPRELMNETHWAALVSTALPAEDAKKIGTSTQHGLQWALKRLEDRIVEELRRSIAEDSAGLDSVSDAQRILEAADKVQASAAAGLARAHEASTDSP